MEYAPFESPVNDGTEDNITIGPDYYNLTQFNNLDNLNNLNNKEPVHCINTIYTDSLIIKENILNIIQKKDEIIVIDNEQYKNKEIDEIVTKIESFIPEFKKLQEELSELLQEYIKNAEKSKKDVQTIEKSVDFMKSVADDYDKDESVKEIVDKLNKYSESILKNEKLSEIREKYINKRKELNSYIYFIQKINKWNVCNMCPMCFSNKIDSFCDPCGHTGCKDCFDKQSITTEGTIHSKRCPFCREYIADIKPLYFL